MTRRITVRSGAVPRKVIPPASAAVRGPIETTFLVAASDARSDIKAVADYVCDGTDDQEEINTALAAVSALPFGGVVQLSAGWFQCSDYVFVSASGVAVWLRGAGRLATYIATSGNAPSTRDGLIKISAEHPTVTDLEVDVQHNGYVRAIEMSNPFNSKGTLARVTATMQSPSDAVFDGAISVDSDVSVVDVDVTSNNKGNGIQFAGLPGRQVAYDCVVLAATAEGIDATGWGYLIRGPGVSNVRISNCYATNCAGDGIFINSDDAIIIGNDVADGIVINTSRNGTVLGGNIGTITDNGINTRIFDDDTDAIHDNVDGEIVLVTEKVSPVGADVLLIEDSEASDVKKRVQITNLPLNGAIPVKTDTGDPGSPFEGQIYVNTFDNKVRVYADADWRDLATW